MSDGSQPSIVPFGEAALLVRLGERVDPLLNARVHALADLVRRERDRGELALDKPVPGYASLLVPFDPLAGDPDELARWLHGLLGELPGEVLGERLPPIEIEVRYGADDGPDLDDVAARLGLAPDDVVRLHQSVDYRVYMLGFAPGFGYLGSLPAELELPRRDTPRQRVPAGSVAIAARQTAVYPLATPGGWHIIGRTGVRLWDTQRDPPALLAPGRLVRFVAVEVA